MTSIESAIAKALEVGDGDTERERTQKALIAKQLEAGTITVEKLGAELALEAIAKTARERDPSLSYEQHFVRALDGHPDLAAALY